MTVDDLVVLDNIPDSREPDELVALRERSIVARVEGSSNLVLMTEASHTFTSMNWSNAMTVSVEAFPDFDRVNGTATFQCSASGLPLVLVAVTEQDATPEFEFTVTSANPAWGTVSVTGGAYPAGNSVQVTANPATYYQFQGWAGDYVGTNNPLMLIIASNVTIQAHFTEMATLQYRVPFWWLAEHGYTSDFESTENIVGLNGLPLWQSYVAGLEPGDPTSQLRLSLELGSDPSEHVLRWTSVPERLYTIVQSSDSSQGFIGLPDAIDLPATTRSLTNRVSGSAFYRLQVRKP
jgi:hypothetical protein